MIGMLMEFCEGKSLDAVVKESRERDLRHSERVLGRIAAAVLRGLDYLHERKIIHRGKSLATFRPPPGRSGQNS